MKKRDYAFQIAEFAHFHGINEKLRISRIMKRRKSELVKFVHDLDHLFLREAPTDSELCEFYAKHGFIK